MPRDSLAARWAIAHPETSDRVPKGIYGELRGVSHPNDIARRELRQVTAEAILYSYEAYRAVVARFARFVPREGWAVFCITSQAILRWHRALAQRHWTYPHRRPERLDCRKKLSS